MASQVDEESRKFNISCLTEFWFEVTVLSVERRYLNLPSRVSFACFVG